MTDPLLQDFVDAVGYDAYEARWKSLSSLARFWYTLRGWNPGGRKGAPPLK